MYVRLVFEKELVILRETRELKGFNKWDPYKVGEVICMFETTDVESILRRYGSACATGRFEERTNGILNCSILLIEPPSLELLEVDKSQVGWSESRAYLGIIPIENIRILGTANFNASSIAMTTFQNNSFIVFNEPLEID
ncbi:MAG: hypothetical protein IPP64_06675 [Bacteroidetes bacterium]|nr:hypothetical protein [Bacteroidota bacterium]